MVYLLLSELCLEAHKNNLILQVETHLRKRTMSLITAVPLCLTMLVIADVTVYEIDYNLSDNLFYYVLAYYVLCYYDLCYYIVLQQILLRYLIVHYVLPRLLKN